MSSSMATKRKAVSGKKYCLVHWIEDDQIGVIPETYIKKGQMKSVSAYVDCKWGKKYYQARILKMSGKC